MKLDPIRDDISTSSARAARLAAILFVAALPRIWAAIWDQGIFWPDEIFQTLEPAHRFAFGHGFVSWEFQDGARSWLFPGALGLLWKLLTWLGVSGAPTLVISAKLAMVVLALAGIYASMRIGEKLGGAEAGLLAGVLAAGFPPAIVYGSRCMTEMASGPLIAVAALLILDTTRGKLAAAGCLAALAVYLRYQNGLVAVALLGVLFAERRQRDARYFAVGAAAIALAGSLLDFITWGAPFHSLLAYLRFNVIEGRSASFGVEPFSYYVAAFWSAAGVSMLAVAIGLWESARRAPGLLAVVLVYVAAHSLVGHKELRFMMPIVPLMLALAGVGMARFIDRLLSRSDTGVTRGRRQKGRDRNDNRRAHELARSQVRKPVWVVVAVLAVAMTWRTTQASFDDFGQRDRAPFSGSQSLWHRHEAINRLLWSAGKQADLCGLGLVGYGPVWTGGYAYLHRDVPMLWATPEEALAQPGLGAIGASANYVLTRAAVTLPESYATVEIIGDAKLARRAGPCATPPDSYTRLLPK